MNYTKEFSTNDLGLAAALLTAEFKLLKLDKTEGITIVKFVFKREEGIEQKMMDHFNSKLELKTISFYNNIRYLKNRLHQEEV